MAQTAINQQLTTDHGSRGLCMRIRGGPCGEQRCQDPTEWRESEPRKRQKKEETGGPPTVNAGGHVRRAVENLASGRRLTGFIVKPNELPYMSLYPIMSSLPQKPTENTFQSSSAAGPSKICAVCSSPAKYTCPRCSARSCSLNCSQIHKSRDSCSGIRDPAKFVPLNQYGQGVWSSDYTLLEEGRRQIAGWGKGIKIEEVNGGVVSSRGRGRGSRAPKGQRRSKTDGLRRELERYGCRAEFMPEGMGRKKTNQSSWNPKSVPFNNYTLYLD